MKPWMKESARIFETSTRIKIVIVVLLTIISSTVVEAAELTEQQARITAAWWVQGSLFEEPTASKAQREFEKRGGVGGQADAVWDVYARSPNLPVSRMMNAKTKELLQHIDQAFLVVRGDTGYCGKIKALTWVIIGDKEFAELHGGVPVMINARTGKVLDCRS